MSDKKSPLKARTNNERLFEADTFALQSLRLIAAPNPKDDLTDEELGAYFKKHKFSSDMIKQIVDTVKSL